MHKCKLRGAKTVIAEELNKEYEDTELAVCAILRCAGGLSIVEWKATDRSMSLETFVTADRESYDLDYANVLRALGNEVPWLSKHCQYLG